MYVFLKKPQRIMGNGASSSPERWISNCSCRVFSWCYCSLSSIFSFFCDKDNARTSSEFGRKPAFSGFFLLVFSEFRFQPSYSFYAKNGQTSILAGLGKSEEDKPQNAFCFHTDGQSHLREGENIKRDAHQQDDNPGAERKTAEPFLHAGQGLLKSRLYLHKQLYDVE